MSSLVLFLSSRRVRLEAFDTLLFSNKGGDGDNLFIAETVHGWHGTKIPVMLGRAPEDGELESAVCMVARLVDPGQMRWPLIGPSKILSMTGSTVRRVEIGAGGH